MKPLFLTNEMKTKIFEKMFEKLKKEIDDYEFNMNENSVSFKADFSEVAKEKVNIMYSQKAYLRMRKLVDHFTTEVAWYGLSEKLDDHNYYIYDVKVCKQYVNGAKVDTEDEDTLEFFNSLNDDEAEHMHFQAHSHVNMSTSASGTDLQNQADVIRNMGHKGYYIFQIWNKSGDINTYLYDLDNNTFYDRKDVNLTIEDPLGSLDDFVKSIDDLVCTKRVYPYQWTGKKKEKEEEKYEPSYLPGYYDGFYGNGGYDW